MLKVVEPKPGIDYMAAYLRIMESINNDVLIEPPCERLRLDLMKYARALVCFTNGLPETEDYATTLKRFEFLEMTKEVLSLLTPRELVNTFPPEKIYDGSRWGMKDYFTTKMALDALPPNEAIGEELLHLLWDFENHQTGDFIVSLMCIVGDLHRAQTGKSMIAEFFEQQGTPLTTYHLHKDPGTGQEYMLGSDGTTQPVSTKPRLQIMR